MRSALIGAGLALAAGNLIGEDRAWDLSARWSEEPRRERREYLRTLNKKVAAHHDPRANIKRARKQSHLARKK